MQLWLILFNIHPSTLSCFSLKEVAGITYPVHVYIIFGKLVLTFVTLLNLNILREKNQYQSSTGPYNNIFFFILIGKVVLKMAAQDFILQLAAAAQSASLSVFRL